MRDDRPLRTALLSDVHGNAVALRAVLDELDRERIDHIVCLGDMIQGGPEPAVVVDLLRERACPVVLGNADAFVLDAAAAEDSPEEITERQLEIREWTLAQLTSQDVAFVKSFRPTLEIELGGGRRLLACHGSPRSYDDVLFPMTPEPEFRGYLDDVDADVVAGGHVHLQFLRRVGARFFVNPGSVGLSYDHEQPEEDFRIDPWAAYAVVDDRLRIEFRRLPLDVEGVVAAILGSGIPYAHDAAASWPATTSEAS